jgi:hypothetical protein
MILLMNKFLEVIQNVELRMYITAALRTRFAVLCAGFVWFVVLTFPKFNLYTS